MLLTAQRARFDLADDEVVHLRDARDSRLDVTEGFVWVTVEGERNDVVIGAGESFLIDSRDVVTVSALRGAAALEVRADADAGAGTARRIGAPRLAGTGRLQQLLAGVSLSSVAVA